MTCVNVNRQPFAGAVVALSAAFHSPSANISSFMSHDGIFMSFNVLRKQSPGPMPVPTDGFIAS